MDACSKLDFAPGPDMALRIDPSRLRYTTKQAKKTSNALAQTDRGEVSRNQQEPLNTLPRDASETALSEPHAQYHLQHPKLGNQNKFMRFRFQIFARERGRSQSADLLYFIHQTTLSEPLSFARARSGSSELPCGLPCMHVQLSEHPSLLRDKQQACFELQFLKLFKVTVLSDERSLMFYDRFQIVHLISVPAQ